MPYSASDTAPSANPMGTDDLEFIGFAAPEPLELDFVPIRGTEPHPRDQGLTAIDHPGRAVRPGRIGIAVDFWERRFAFRAGGPLAIESVQA